MKKLSLSITAKFLFALCMALTMASTIFGAEPGRPERQEDDARRSLASDQRPGSLLVYNIYASSPTESGKQDTDISMTNVNTTRSAFVHIFFIADGCSTADSYICLTPNQTASFLASDVDPGIKGYIIAYATNDKGCPTSFNYLIGSESVKFESGHTASLGAESYAALYNGTLPGCSAADATARIALDGVRYNAAPRVLAVDKIPSPVTGNSTMLILNSLEGDLAIGMKTIGTFGGVLFDDAESAFSFSATAPCQFRLAMSDAFPVTTPVFSQVIPSGRTGWMRLMARDERAISGAVINFNPNAATRRNAFTGGHNLHHVSYTTGGFLTPVFPPSC